MRPVATGVVGGILAVLASTAAMAQSAYDDAMFSMKGGGHGHRP